VGLALGHEDGRCNLNVEQKVYSLSNTYFTMREGSFLLGMSLNPRIP
jgi:hypothetical protein